MKSNMKYTKYILLASIITSMSFMKASAQNIQSEAGIRLGGTTAFTYKKMFENLEAAEIMMSGRENGLQFTGLYEKHQQMTWSLGDNFYAYWGFGGHLGFIQSEPVILRSDSSGVRSYQVLDIRRKTFFLMGLDGIAGIEYHIYSVPLSLALDFKPTMELIGMRYMRARVWDFGVSAKYIF